MKKISKSISIVLLFTLTSCSVNNLNSINNNNKINSNINLNMTLSGQVIFPKGKFNTKATQDNILSSTTISILYPSNTSSLINSTVATGLTDSLGKFKINPVSTFKPTTDQIYILEARKRLGGEGNKIICLKTLIKWNGASWTSITGTNIFINTKTTAMAIMSGYNQNALSFNDTINKISVSSSSGVLNSTLSDISSVINQTKISEITSLVEQVITDNKDPIAEIKYDYQSAKLSYGNKTISYDKYERTTIKGKVYDINGTPLANRTVAASSYDMTNLFYWNSTQVTTGVDGSYEIQNVPVGVKTYIFTFESTGTLANSTSTPRARIETISSNLTNDPNLNIYNFGGSTADSLYAVQDEPEIVFTDINYSTIDSSSLDDDYINGSPKNSKPSVLQLSTSTQIANVGNIPSLTSVDSDSVSINIYFSEPVDMNDIKNYLRITSQTGINGDPNSYVITPSTLGTEFTSDSSSTSLNFKINKSLLANKTGNEARYMIDFSQPFRDKSGKQSISGKSFRFNYIKPNDFALFSVANDTRTLTVDSIDAIDGGTGNDKLRIFYNKPMESIAKTSYSSILIDPIATDNNLRKIWYRDSNNIAPSVSSVSGAITDNNSTILGFLSGSDTDTSLFKGVYTVGRVKASDITSKTPKLTALGSDTRTLSTIPIKANITNDLIKSVVLNKYYVDIELSPSAFELNDKVIVSTSGTIISSYKDTNVIPNINEDLSVTPIGDVINYASIYDPLDNLLNTGNLFISDNFNNTDSQKSTTVVDINNVAIFNGK